MKVPVVGVPGMEISVVNKVLALKVSMHGRNNCYKKKKKKCPWLKSPYKSVHNSGTGYERVPA